MGRRILITDGFANAQSHYADPSILWPAANQTHTVSQYESPASSRRAIRRN